MFSCLTTPQGLFSLKNSVLVFNNPAGAFSPLENSVWVFNNQSPSYMKRSVTVLSLSTDGAFATPQIAPTVATRHIEFVGDSM